MPGDRAVLDPDQSSCRRCSGSAAAASSKLANIHALPLILDEQILGRSQRLDALDEAGDKILGVDATVWRAIACTSASIFLEVYLAHQHLDMLLGALSRRDVARRAKPARDLTLLIKDRHGPHACGGVIADKAFDTNALRKQIADMGAEAVIPSKRSTKVPIPHDEAAYRTRNRIERCINKVKHFRRAATRYDRPSAHFLAFVVLACIMIWMR